MSATPESIEAAREQELLRGRPYDMIRALRSAMSELWSDKAGLLGAGVILKVGASIRGLNTAATLWCSAAVGTFSGAGLPIEAASVTSFVLAGNTLLRPLVNWINRRPITEDATEAQYRVHAVCDRDHVPDVRDLLDTLLSDASYPIRAIETLSESEEQIELAADLVPTTAAPAELDQVVAKLEASPLVRSATWSVGTTA